jgi:hypothetical protein
MGFKDLVRDQEVDGSNPFAPTTPLESAIYTTRKIRGAPGPKPCAPLFESVGPERSWHKNPVHVLRLLHFCNVTDTSRTSLEKGAGVARE